MEAEGGSCSCSAGLKFFVFSCFPCLPAFTTLGAVCSAFKATGESAGGEAKGEHGGVARGPEADLGEVGELEEADREERFLRPAGTGLGAVA